LTIGTSGYIESHKKRNNFIMGVNIDVLELKEGKENATPFKLEDPIWSEYTGAISIKLDYHNEVFRDVYFIAHTNGKIYCKQSKWHSSNWWFIVTNTDKKNATFYARPGLADSSWITFESGNYPGCYLKLGYEEKYLVWVWRWWPPSWWEERTRYVEKLCIISRGDSNDSEVEFNSRATFRFV